MTQTLDSKSLDDLFTLAGTVNERLGQRLKARVEMRKKEGRKLSSATVSQILSDIDTIKNSINMQESAVADLHALIESAQPSGDKAQMAMLETKHRYNNVLKGM